MKGKQILIQLAIIGVLFTACINKSESEKASIKSNTTEQALTNASGKLFIIGGGKRPPELIQHLIEISEIKKDDAYTIILPMSSAEPDTAAFYASKQFTELGIKPDQIKTFNFQKGIENEQWLDSLRKADLIYITGGDQTKFMDVVLNSSVYDAMHLAYKNGATIAGTSAGAAVMSKKMITGNEYKHPEYTGDFRTIEANNIELTQGMGFAPNIIVDQHFIWRMRMNRLMSVAIENPNQIAVGIDESTALIINGDMAEVSGLSQVIFIKNSKGKAHEQNGLLGADQLDVSVKLPGSKFKLSNFNHSE